MNRSERHLIRTATRTVVALGLVGLAGVVYSVLVRTAPQAETSNTANVPPRISVIRAAKVPVQRPWRGFGTAVAIDSADVPARVTATVSQIGDDILAGVEVKKGQLLVKLDASDFQRQVEIAQQMFAELDAQLAMLDVQKQKLVAQLELESQDVGLATDDRDRIEQLQDRGAANPRDFDLAKRAVIAAKISQLESFKTLEELGPRRLQLEAQRAAEQSSLKLAKQNLDRCHITSPIDGTIQSVDVEVGENINSGDRVARVVNLKRIEVPLKLPASGRPEIGIGDHVQLRATNQTGQSWNTRVVRIAPEDDTSTRTVTVYIELTQHDDGLSATTDHDRKSPLVPGMFVAGVVTSGQTHQRWIVPRRSVQDGRILLVNEGVVQIQPVNVKFVLEGKQPLFNLPDDQWAVLDAPEHFLHDGAMVIINGSTSVHEGRIVNPTVVAATATPRAEGTAP